MNDQEMTRLTHCFRAAAKLNSGLYRPDQLANKAQLLYKEVSPKLPQNIESGNVTCYINRVQYGAQLKALFFELAADDAARVLFPRADTTALMNKRADEILNACAEIDFIRMVNPRGYPPAPHNKF